MSHTNTGVTRAKEKVWLYTQTGWYHIGALTRFLPLHRCAELGLLHSVYMCTKTRHVRPLVLLLSLAELISNEYGEECLLKPHQCSGTGNMMAPSSWRHFRLTSRHEIHAELYIQTLRLQRHSGNPENLAESERSC